MKFTFDLQRFDEVSIAAGDTYALDGVTYTALEDARLNLDDDGKVSGIASGSVSAVVTGRSNPVATVDATNSSTEFTLTGKDEVLTLTKVLPFELDNGTFTLAGNVLTAAKGSDLRIGTGRTYADGTIVFGHDYADTDITYTITDTTLTEETEKGTIIFTASLGEQARSITTFVNGKIINGVADGKFTGGFTITKGSSMGLVLGNYTVKATANADATSRIFVDSKGINITPGSGDGSLNVALSRNGTEIISGELNVTSGKITFGYDNSVTFDKDTSWDFTWNGYTMTATTTDEAQIGVSLQGNQLVLTPGENDGGLNLLLRRGTTPVFGGVLNVTDGTITFDPTTQKFSFTEGTNISITLPGGTPRQVDFKVVGGDASIKVEADSSGKFVLTPDNNDGSLQISVSRDGRTVFQNTFNVSNGSIVFDPATQAVTLTQGTTVSLGLNNYTISATTTDDASFRLALLNDGRIAFVPGENDGALNIAISRGGSTIFQNTVSVSGAIFVNPETLEMTLAEGTNISLSFGNYELNATTTADATVGIAVLESGIAITPTPGDGSLNLTINSADGSLNANVEVISGSFILGDDGLLTVAKDTELQIDFGDGYVINFKATDDAGGSLVLGADGITFVPGTDDGGLELSVTQGGVTRTVSLDVTGSVTYRLDGSISLAKGTVVRNVFDSGNVLTITANTDASGSMIFTPQRGLDITSSTPDALNIVLTTGGVDVAKISSIMGSINYTGGVVTVSDGTKISMTDYEGYDSILTVDGGTASVKFGTDRAVYTANEGATFTFDWLDGHTWQLHNGTTLTDTYNGYAILSEGATFNSNDDLIVEILEKAGNYILNGMNIATTQDGVQVVLSNYDTVTFEADAGIVFDGQEFSGDGIITLTDGAIVIENTEDNVAVNGTEFNDRITNSGDNVTINALGGNDTINSSGNGNKIDGGAGNNVVSLGSAGSNIVFDGNTTVEGFKTGWGNGSDTVYVNTGSDPGVDFKTNGLTFYDGNDSLTLDDVDDTAKVNLYYETSDTIARNVYIAQNDWYQVSNSDLNSGEGIYFVGTSATHNHGVDFSGVSQALNVTMNTDYDATNNSIWVNNVYSIRGGAGNTTITGTPDSDTIIAGRGSTTIDGAGGSDIISLDSARALVNYNSGGGSDSIYGFNANSTMSIGGGRYSSATSGNNLILNVGSDYVTLFGAASLNNPHILGTASGGSATIPAPATQSGGDDPFASISSGVSTSTTSGGTSTTGGGSSTVTTSGGTTSEGTTIIHRGTLITPTVSGSSSTTTQSGGSSTSTTSGGSSTSTTSGGTSTSSVVSGATSTTSSVVSASSSYGDLLNSLRSGVSSSRSTTSSGSSTSTATATPAAAYVYTGGDQVITNYTAGAKIALGTYPTGGAFVDGNFVLSSASGNLVVQNATDKVVDFTDGAGNDFIKAYAATNAGVIDGRGLGGFELINGSAGNDWIYAGDGGSQLWGGSGAASDMLTGGAGTDIFVAGKYQGADVINNAETKDIINISDATLSDIIATAENNGLVAVTFNNGNAVAVQSSEALSAAFQLADGSAWRYNHATKGWQSA